MPLVGGALLAALVALTFLYTSCPDVCPRTTVKLRETYQLPGDAVGDVAFFTVTVDPEKDTIPRVYDYSQRWDVVDKWHFLVGSGENPQPLWAYYWVGEVVREAAGIASYGLRLESVAEEGDPDRPRELGAYTLGQGAPIHVIDGKGRVRVVFGSTFQPPELASGIQVLLR